MASFLVNSSKLWKPVVSKVQNKKGNWKGKWLKKAGWATMIKSVLSAIPTYQMSILPLPVNIKANIDKLLRDFYWQGTTEENKTTLIRWENLCKPISLGGLGIKNLQWQNKALGAKLVWRIYKDPNRKWASILLNKYILNVNPINIFRSHSHTKGSHIWNFIIESREVINNHLTWDIGTGDMALFWEDSWGGFTP